MDKILLWGFYFLTFYAFLPGFISRIFGFRVFSRGRTEREIALTFDDGPDPEYTPQLLDLLQSHGAKATFFVVGANAERHPELIRRMHAEGHDIGIHNYVHRSNWLMRPKSVKRQVHRTAEIIKRLTGERPRFYRPPWGIVNVFDFANLGHLQIVLWSAMFGDWRKKIGADGLYRRIRRKLQPGAVLLLHDRGTTFGADREAPANTIAALSRILPEGRELGYRFVNMQEMIALTEQNKIKSAASPAGAGAGGRPAAGWWKRRVVALWMGWERLFHVLFRVRPVGDGTSFHYRVIRYGGRPLPLSNGETLRAGDHVMELHFDNQMMYEIGMTSKSEVHTAIRVIRKVEETLPEIADELALLRDKERIKALYGVTMINRGTEPLGFEAFEMTPGLFAWLTNRYLRLLMSIIHPRGHERLRTGSERMRPRMLVMPVDLVVQWGVTRTRPSKAQRQRAEKRESPDAPLRVAEERMTETSM